MPENPYRQSSRPTNARRTNTRQRRKQHVLDVSVRAHQASRHRTQRVFGVVCWFLIVAGICAGLFFGGKKLAARLFFKNPDYDLAFLNVETDGVLSPDEILAAADLRKGTNILKLDLERARARLSAIPQVEKVQVTRQLPNRVSIQINERKPVAWIALDRGAAPREEVVAAKTSFFIDANGVLLPPKKVSQTDTYLPIIRHYNGPIAPGQEADGEEIRAALDLLHAQQDSLVATRYQIDEIDLSKQFGLMVTERSGAHVLLPLDNMNQQLQRMGNYLQGAEARGQKVQTMNLLVQNNVPVTFQPEPTPPPPDPNAPAPSASPSSGSKNSKKDKSGKSRNGKPDKSEKSDRAGGKSQSTPAPHHKDAPAASPATAAASALPLPASAPRPATPLQPFN